MSIVDIINSRQQPVRNFMAGGDADTGGDAIPEITVTAPRINPSLGVGMGSLSARMGQISLGNLGINILGAIKDFQIAGMSEAEIKEQLEELFKKNPDAEKALKDAIQRQSPQEGSDLSKEMARANAAAPGESPLPSTWEEIKRVLFGSQDKGDLGLNPDDRLWGRGFPNPGGISRVNVGRKVGNIEDLTKVGVGTDFSGLTEEQIKAYEDEQKQILMDNEVERLREEARRKSLIDSDVREPPLRVGEVDPNVHPISGEPWGNINLGGLTPEQMKEFGLGTSVPTEEEIKKAIAEDENTTPEEKNALEKAAKELLDRQNTGRLAAGKAPQVGSGGFWSNIGIITGVAGGIALLGNLFGGGSSPKKGGVANLPGSTTPESTTPGSTTPESTTPGSTTPGSTTPESTTPESTTPGTGTPAPGSVTAKTPQEAYEIALEQGGWESLDPNSQAMASGHASTLPQGIVPGWLLALMGLGAILGGSSDDPEPTSLQEAAARRSMEVYGNANLFDPTGPSPLQEIDPAFRNIKTFMPEGQVPDFGLVYRGVPGQMYANYEGTGPRGVAGLRGNITPMAQVAQVAQGGLMGLAHGGSPSYPRMNGQITGPGTEKSDDIPAMLSDGEFVVNAAGVRGIGNLMGNKKPKSKAAQRREGARMMYALQRAGEKAARMA